MQFARGFTLIELLVVVALILILAAVLLPVYETATRSAERATCMTNLRSLAGAVMLYAQDNDGRLVPARSPSGLRNTDLCWDVILEPYYRSRMLLLCPADRMPNTASSMVCLTHSYGINHDLTLVGGYSGASLLMDQVDRPAQTVLFFDLRGSVRSTGLDLKANGLSRVDARHGSGANFAYLAGNVKWNRPPETLQPRDLTGADNHWEP